MKNDYEGFFSKDVQSLVDTLIDLNSRVDAKTQATMDETYKTMVEAFDRSCVACRQMDERLSDDPEQLKEVKERFREAISPLLGKSWCYSRALNKPRGYPGDAGLLTVMYDNVPLATGFAGYVDLYFLSTTLAYGIRERLRCAKTFLIEELERRHGDVSVLNVACGPVREYEGGIEHPSDVKIHINCLDSDAETLDYVKKRSTTGAFGDLDINCVCYNALRTSSTKNNIRMFGQPDILYSIGLCDYIPDEYLIPMLQGWRETVNDGGVVYVAFKDTRRYSHTIYQWYTDWNFYLRTEEDCRSLFEQAGYDVYGLKMTRDTTGSIFNFIGRKKKLSYIRIDRAEPRVAEPLSAPVRSREEELAVAHSKTS
jgi:hypothetical protein